jgi:hypothetical protein
MRRIGVALAMLVALTTVAAAAEARPAAKPKVRTVRLALTYGLDAAYSNQSELGEPSCNAGGNETADVGVRFDFRAVKLKLASGAQTFAKGSIYPTESSWSEKGTQDVDPSGDGILCPPDFANPKPLSCSGAVGVLRDPPPAPASLLVGVVRGTVFFAVDTGGDLGELGQDHCGESDVAAIPYLGLAKALKPYDSVVARIPLATLAKKPTQTLTAKPSSVPSGYDPAHCDGAVDTTIPGQSCTAKLTIHKVTIGVRPVH